MSDNVPPPFKRRRRIWPKKPATALPKKPSTAPLKKPGTAAAALKPATATTTAQKPAAASTNGQMVGMDTDQATEAAASSSHQNSLPTSNAGGSDVPLPGGPSEKGVAGGAGVSASVLVRCMIPGDVDAV